MTKRPTKTKKLEDAFSPSTIPTEQNKERTDHRLVRLGHFILTYHLQKFVENHALQPLLKEHDRMVSWDEEKKKLVVVTSPRRSARAKMG